MVLFRPHIVRLLAASTKVMVAVAMLSVAWAAATPHTATFSHVSCIGAEPAVVMTVESSYVESRSDVFDGVTINSVDASSKSESVPIGLAVNDCCDATACMHNVTMDLVPTERFVSVVLAADTGNLDGRAMPVEPRPPRQLI